jgi:hypothetical protein
MMVLLLEFTFQLKGVNFINDLLLLDSGRAGTRDLIPSSRRINEAINFTASFSNRTRPDMTDHLGYHV